MNYKKEIYKAFFVVTALSIFVITTSYIIHIVMPGLQWMSEDQLTGSVDFLLGVYGGIGLCVFWKEINK